MSKYLRDFVNDMISDKRFEGLSYYIANVVFNWNNTIPTACAGHGFVFVNQEFFSSLSDDSKKTVLAHEIFHLILKHHSRVKNHNHRIYNMAADYVINCFLTSIGFDIITAGGILDLKYKNMSTEEVYTLLYSQNKNLPVNNDNTFISPNKIDELIKETLKEEKNLLTKETLKDVIEKNEKLLQKINVKPLQIQRILNIDKNSLVQKNVPYKTIFKEYFIDPLSSGKRSFSKPNRRSDNIGPLILAGKTIKNFKKHRLTHLTYALDVSGSISKHQANMFHSSVYKIKKLLNPEKLTILFFDDKIVLEKTFTDKEEYKDIKVNVGGGTCLRDVYRRAKELNTKALIVFTDLEVEIPPKPEHDVIWFIPNMVKTNRVHYGNIYIIPEN